MQGGLGGAGRARGMGAGHSRVGEEVLQRENDPRDRVSIARREKDVTSLQGGRMWRRGTLLGNGHIILIAYGKQEHFQPKNFPSRNMCLPLLYST